jgi:large subunit ribosomal protein L6e
MRIEFIYKIVGMVKKFEWYPGDDRKKHFQRIKKTIRKKTKLRKGLDAGTICILLSGRFKGKRVVFLKQLDSGLLLVTGPYKINGVPLRRVNQAYVIPTSTVVEVPQMPDMQDSYFAKEKKGKSSQEEKFFAQDAAVVIQMYF